MAHNKMVRVLMGDGVPTYLNHKPSPAMLSAMRAAMSTSRKYSRDHDELAALAYVTWWARSRHIPVPTASIAAAYGVKVLARVKWDWPDGADKARPRWVSYETGSYSSEMLYSPRGKFKGYGETKWHTDKVLLRLEIPNWDHIPTVTELDTRRDVAA